MAVIALNELVAAAGSELGKSRWFEMSQSRICAFAETTEDRQWIHVDPARGVSGPFGSTIAHGFLTLSLIPAGLAEIMVVIGADLTINYGLGRVRFPAPVPADSKVRICGSLANATEVDGAVDATISVIVECDKTTKPACVAEILLRFVRPGAVKPSVPLPTID